jgi:hypothetical protein
VILQPQFSILCGPSWFWDQKTLGRCMTAWVFFHNVIIEHERYDEDFDHCHNFIDRWQSRRREYHIKHFLEVYRVIQ